VDLAGVAEAVEFGLGDVGEDGDFAQAGYGGVREGLVRGAVEGGGRFAHCLIGFLLGPNCFCFFYSFWVIGMVCGRVLHPGG
jgi:hypothetical protein